MLDFFDLAILLAARLRRNARLGSRQQLACTNAGRQPKDGTMPHLSEPMEIVV